MASLALRTFAISLGAGVGGAAFLYAHNGAISWWFVLAMFAWVISVGASVI